MQRLTLWTAFVLLSSQAYGAYDEGKTTPVINQPGLMSSSDDNIARNISDILSSVSFSRGFELISFTIDKGKVNLQGSVQNLQDKMRLEKAIRSIPGVSNVDNQISVREQDTSMNEYAHAASKHTTTPSHPVSHKYRDENRFRQDSAVKDDDKRLNSAIRSQGEAQQLWKKYPAVRFNTVNGVVTLEGAVPSVADREQLIQTIQGTQGVKSVKSNLQIRK